MEPATGETKPNGVAFAFAVTPGSGGDDKRLDVVTHYRVDDFTMERKRLFGRKEPVPAGIVDLKSEHEESMTEGDVLAFYQRMPYSGDTLPTLVTVTEVQQAGAEHFSEDRSD
jgi:hypothetical protein